MAEGRGELADLMVAGRLRSGLTQEELALRAGVSTRTVRNVEGGHVVRPRLHTVRLLAAAMKASHDDADRMLAAATRDRMGVRSGSSEPEMADVPAAAGPAAVIPAQLPLDVFGFTGRHAELRALDDFHGAARPRSTAVLISAVSGTAGVGKTALAVHWAYQARDQFPSWPPSARACRWRCGSPRSWPCPGRPRRWPSWPPSWPTSSGG